MNFGKFIRKYSTDTDNENSQSKSSLISNTTKLFDSVNTKTTSLVSGISNTFENIKRRTSIETLTFTDKEASKQEEDAYNDKAKPIQSNTLKYSEIETIEPKPVYQEAKSYIDQSYQMKPDINKSDNFNSQSPGGSALRKNPPPKPPPPLTKQKSAPHEEDKQDPKDMFQRSQTMVDNDIIEDMYHNEFLKKEGGQLANEVLADAKNKLEELTQMECQKFVSAMDDLISFDQPNFPTQTVDENSSPSEYGDRGDQPIYGDHGQKLRRFSNGSLDSEPEELNSHHREFLEAFVANIYIDGHSLHDEETFTKFKKYIQSQSGKCWLGKLVEKYQSIHSKKVSEVVFYRLLQLFTFVLLECLENEEFLPARDLMLVAFSCYTVVNAGSNQIAHNFYLSSFISCHPIWKSIQFWNVCFFNSVQEVRSKRATMRRNSANTTDADGVAFHQLQVHLNYMRSLGLPIELCSEFVRKQVNIVNLTEDEMRRLKEVIESWKE